MKVCMDNMVDFVQKINFSDLPEDVIKKAKLHFLDAIGVGVAAAQEDFSREIVYAVRELDGKAKSSIFYFGDKVSVPNAAFANGAMVHGLDFDDTMMCGEGAAIHPSSCVIPTVLAVGEAEGIDGRTLITAAVVGWETMGRIALRCSTNEMKNALGICGSQAAGLLETLNDGSWTKRLHSGWASHSGIIAAIVAQKGFTGPHRIFEGQWGLYNSHLGIGNYDLERLEKGWGSSWETLRLCIKPYPCCNTLHAFIDCAKYLKRKYNLNPKEIIEIECRVTEDTKSLVCEPINEKKNPSTTYSAKLSLPFAVAVGFLEEEVDIDTFSEKKIKDPNILELANKVKYVIDSSTFSPLYFPAWVKIMMKNGKIYEHKEEINRGSTGNPLTEEEVKTKFRNNARRTLSKEKVETIIDLVTKLDELDNISDIISVCTR